MSRIRVPNVREYLAERATATLSAYSAGAALPTVAEIDAEFEKAVDESLALSPEELRTRAEASGSETPRKQTATTTTFRRDPKVAAWARVRAEGLCDLCGSQAPFLNKKGEPYLETHHVVWLSKGGADTVGNVVALCPNCHARVHALEAIEDRDALAAR